MIITSPEYTALIRNWMQEREYIETDFSASQFIADFSHNGILCAVAYSGYNGSMIEATIVCDTMRKEMLKTMFDYPFNQLAVNKIIARAESSNKKSVRFVRKAGFVLECTLKDCAPSGDLLIYSLDRKKCRYLQSA